MKRVPTERPRSAPPLVLSPVGQGLPLPPLRLVRQPQTPAEAVAAALDYSDRQRVTDRATAARAAFDALAGYDSAHAGWYGRGDRRSIGVTAPKLAPRRFGIDDRIVSLMAGHPSAIDAALARI